VRKGQARVKFSKAVQRAIMRWLAQGLNHAIRKIAGPRDAK